MPNIRSLFDPELPIDRPIEKVITFSNRQPEVLTHEAREYVLTDNLSKEYEKLLGKFEDAQAGDRGNDCCVWLSGFYGSGKSSFAKYFGLTFDPTAVSGDTHFSDYFLKQFPSQPFQTRLKAVRSRFDVAVFLLDLASQGTAGVTHTPISTLLFDQVCAWAGFASDRKIAELETFLLHENRLEEFHQRAEAETGLTYNELASLPGILLPIASDLAHEFFPNIWRTAEAFQNATAISTQSEAERVEQMLALVEKKTGTRRVLFVIDEVGHFLRNNDALINNLDGLAKNIKELSDGKAWIIATAQQTLPSTGPLFGLRDRFPIKIDLRASDIREITHKRLLRKSIDGKKLLETEFKNHGQRLTLMTKLKDITLGSPLDETTFCDFYPMLPQQFDILISAISSLAKLQGGIGLRSAIRCVQDILIHSHGNQTSVVSREIPALVTCADLYDVLETDLSQSAREITIHVDNISRRYGADSWAHRIAKSIAILQQIEGFPVSRHNLAALLYPEVGADPIASDVSSAIDSLLTDPLVPIGETDGSLSYLSEKVSQIEKERQNVAVTTTSRLTVQNRLLRELFQRPPKAVIDGAKTIESGVCLFDGFREQEITGRDRDIRFLLRLVTEGELADTKKTLINESLASANQSLIYIAAALPVALDAALAEVHRADEIRRIYRNDSDRDVQRYLTSQEQLADAKAAEVRQFLTQSLNNGWVIFRGNAMAATTLGSTLEAAMRDQLVQAASAVFNKFKHAADNVAGEIAEKFLRVKDLSQIASALDPLSVVTIQGTATEINLKHPALVEIQDFLTRHPTPEGKRLLDEFSRPPYGWSKDTTRYLIAALFYAQRIKIRTNGSDLSVIGDLSLAAFRNNSAFNQVNVLQNTAEVPTEVRQLAAQRLTELTGENILPLPQKISEVAVKHLPRFLLEVQKLPQQVAGLGLPEERLSRLQSSITNALMGDGSDSAMIFGAQDSELYQDLLWTRSIKKALDHGAADTLSELSQLLDEARRLSSQGILPDLPEALEAQGSETLERIKDGTFHEDIPTLARTLEELQALVTQRSQEQIGKLTEALDRQITSLKCSSDFKKLDSSRQVQLEQRLNEITFQPEATLAGLAKAQTNFASTANELQSIREEVEKAAAPVHPRVTVVADKPGAEKASLPSFIETLPQLDAAIQTLESHRYGIGVGKALNLSIED
jgi:hypothetical protein